MLALGVILVLLAAVMLISALVGGPDESVGFDLGLVQGEISATGVFLLGALTVLLLVAGLVLVRIGLRRANRHRRNARELERRSAEPSQPESEPTVPPTSESGAGDGGSEHRTER